MPKKRIILIIVFGVILFLIIAIINSFSPGPPIYYKYNGVTITRLDHIHGEAETHFFYGYYDGKKYPYPNSFIKVTYHGIDGSMSGYLKFLSNKKVEIITEYGWYEKIGTDTDIYIREFYKLPSNYWYDSTQYKYRSTIYFSGLDKDDNIKNYSDVKIEYK